MKYKFAAVSLAVLAGLAASADAQEAGPVLITEIMYNPSGVDEGQEWVEIYNPTAATIDVSRWKLIDDDGATDRFPDGTTLGPGAVAVVLPIRGGVIGNGTTRRSTYTNSAAAFATAWGAGVQLIFVDSFWNYPADPIPVTGTPDGLSNAPSPTNELLQLVNRQGVLIDEVDYDDDEGGVTRWPDDNDSGSIQLLRNFASGTADNNNGAAWRLSAQGDALGSRHANPGAIAFSGLESYGTPGQLPPFLTQDCNSNGQHDAVDIVHGLAVDAYPYNNIPDTCEGDCNGNAVGDLTEIALDWTQDRNLNHTLDSCEINANGGINGVGGARDVNANGILDSFESKPNVVITEVLYNPAGADDGKEFVEIYNAGVTPVSIGGWRLQDIEGDQPTGAVPAGVTLNPAEAAVLMTGSGVGIPADIVPQFRAAWGLSASAKVIGVGPWQDRAQQATSIDEVLAILDASGEPVDVVNYENEEYAPGSAWPNDDGVSSITLAPGAISKSANDLPGNWSLSVSGMNFAHASAATAFINDARDTGSVASPCQVWVGPAQAPTGQAVVTEIMYNPNSNAGDATRAEWLEVYNPSAAPLDLSGWYVSDEDGRTGPLPAGTFLEPSRLMVIVPRGQSQSAAAAESDFRAAWGDICSVAAVTGWSDLEPIPNIGGLANSPDLGNELIVLRRADGYPVDIVNYDDDGIVWPADAAAAAPGLGVGWSITLNPGMYSAVQNDTGTNWAASAVGVNLGRLNTMTPVFNGLDIGSPGLLEGVVAAPACTFIAQCDSVDFNNDGLFPDTQDIDDFLVVFSGGTCSNAPNCNDVDFNNDGLFPDTLDIDALLSVFSGGQCLS